MIHRIMLLAAMLLAIPMTAATQPVDGFYFSGGTGVNLLTNEDAKLNTRFGGAGWIYPPQAGAAFDLSAGYGWSNGLRMELETSYRNNTLSGTDFGGQEQKFGPMVNVLYELSGLGLPLQPYIGAGLGWQWAKDSDLYVVSRRLVVSDATETRSALAYQGILGFAVPIAAIPGLALTADYRLLGLVGDRSYPATVTGLPIVLAGNLRLNNEFNHTFMAGFRYAFGAAPAVRPDPPPALAQPMAISRSYLVFFDWDRSELSDRARKIVADAAMNVSKTQHTSLQVDGYTDTSGTPAYNQALSLRRAQTVAAELVMDGVPKAAIAIEGFGETHLLVPTGPDVREAQNRRVEIIVK